MSATSHQVRLLVVDDQAMNREVLKRRFQPLGYEVILAENGAEALEYVDCSSLDVVVLDIMMPDLDGIEVLRRIRARHDPTSLPVVMATSKDDREDVIRALSLGANDYVIKPIDFEILLARVQTQVGLKRTTEALEVANQRMKQELLAAARIQESLLPKVLPIHNGIRFAWAYKPCEELGGDILNMFKLDEDHIGMYLLDVSGHGVPAALLSSALSHMLSSLPGEGTILWDHIDDPGGPRIAPPATVARRLNERFRFDTETCQYFTLHYGILSCRDRHYKYVSAGHPPPLLLTSEGETEITENLSPAIGIIDDSAYEENSIRLRSGDRLYIVSDGILEATSEDEVEFESVRLVETIRSSWDRNLEEGVSTVVQGVDRWAGGLAQDDISLIALEIE
jgi:sigma-B regulation protein RsbU (phosphoserine phosphatase)